MTFPVVFHPFGFSLHAHLLFEILAYTIGFQLFLRRRSRHPAVDPEHLLWMIAGCITGALLGSKILAWAESFPDYWAHRHEWQYWLGGKTIAGGLIGGWAGVEITKKILGVTLRTGDAYVVPLCVGIAIGRIGCFLSGLEDHTHGIATTLPWGVDFGDGVHRHPAQLYEALFLLILATFIRSTIEGNRFRIFMMAYMLFRFAIEFIKPSWKGYFGLSAIQWASLVTAIIAWLSVFRVRSMHAVKAQT